MTSRNVPPIQEFDDSASPNWQLEVRFSFQERIRDVSFFAVEGISKGYLFALALRGTNSKLAIMDYTDGTTSGKKCDVKSDGSDVILNTNAVYTISLQFELAPSGMSTLHYQLKDPSGLLMVTTSIDELQVSGQNLDGIVMYSGYAEDAQDHVQSGFNGKIWTHGIQATSSPTTTPDLGQGKRFDFFYFYHM